MPENIQLAAGPSGEFEMNVDENSDNLFTHFVNFLKSNEVREDSKNGREYKKLFALLTESDTTEEKFVKLSDILDNLLGGLSDTPEDSSIQPNQFSNEPEQNIDNISENEQYNGSNGNIQNASTQYNQSLDKSELNDDNISDDEQYNRSDDEVLITNKHINVRAKAIELKQQQADPRTIIQYERLKKLFELLHRAEVIETQFKRLYTIMHNMKEQCNVCNPPNQPQDGDNISQNEGIQRSNDNVLDSSTQQNQFMEESDQNDDISEEEIVNISDDEVPIFNKDMSVPIGSGNTWVRGDKYAKINWKTYSTATRSLMRAVFGTSVLATHSLTGKLSPVNQDRPFKVKLNERKVYDVIFEIRNRYEVPKSLIRNIISSQCTQEYRMWRTRCMKSMTKRKKTTKRVRNV